MKIDFEQLKRICIHRVKEVLMLFKYYELGKSAIKKDHVVALFDNRRPGFGLADRLKGMISLYAYCKIKGLDFKCSFTHPFDLNIFLTSNSFRWKIDNEELSKKMGEVRVLIIQGENSPKRLLKVKTEKQIQVYLNRDYLPYFNSHFNMSFDWGELFHELFKFTPALQKQIDFHISQINSEFIGCQLRFLSLLGDFEEKNSVTLNSEDQQLLIEKCTNELIKLKEKNNLPILVTSDSIKFITFISKIEGIITFPDKIVHVDSVGQSESNNVYMKPFIDFILLSKSIIVYNIYSKEMYPSEFPMYAAKLYNIPFKRILI